MSGPIHYETWEAMSAHITTAAIAQPFPTWVAIASLVLAGVNVLVAWLDRRYER